MRFPSTTPLLYALAVAAALFFGISCGLFHDLDELGFSQEDDNNNDEPPACEEGETVCGGQCVTLSDNEDHCGECNKACTTEIDDAVAVCDGGSCTETCSPGQICGDPPLCVDTDNHLNHCGECDNSCSTEVDNASASCISGSCEFECISEAFEYCEEENACVNTDTDTQHCGGCNSPCAPGEYCLERDCICPEEYEQCGEECVNLNANPAHCGGCGTVCEDDAVCSDGICTDGCTDEQTNCDGSCVNTDSNNNHCGECDRSCASQITEATAQCDGGDCIHQCDDPELTACPDLGVCANTDNNTDHCGECGNACAAGNICVGGQCQCDPDAEPFGGGDGTSLTPYQICGAEQFDRIRDELNSHFVLTDDINLNDLSGVSGTGSTIEFDTIGTSSDPFTGELDGNGFAIENFAQDIGSQSDRGLFDTISAQATVTDLTIQVSFVGGIDFVGPLAGTNHGNVHNVDVACFTTADIEAKQDVGGLIGYNTGDVSDSSSNCNIDHTDTFPGLTGTELENAGGLIGRNTGTIERSRATGDINASGETGDDGGIPYAGGGLVGVATSSSEITESAAHGDVTSSGDAVGGLVGRAYAEITDSYAIGDVEGNRQVGGLIGVATSTSTTSNAFSYGEVEGNQRDAGFAGELVTDMSNASAEVYASFWNADGHPDGVSVGQADDEDLKALTPAEFDEPTPNEFTDAGWDFGSSHPWTYDADLERPRLSWE